MRRTLMCAVVTAALAGATFAAMPATASADPVEVEDSSSGLHCESLAAGYCARHWFPIGGWEIIVHTFLGEVTLECALEIRTRLFSDGTEQTEDVDVYDDVDTDCNENLVPCDLPWEGEITHNGAGVETHSMNVCLDPPLVAQCEATYDSTLGNNAGSYFTEGPERTLGFCEWQWHGGYESPSGVEVHHL